MSSTMQSIPQGRICVDNWTCCHTNQQVVDQTCYATKSQYTDTMLTSPSPDPTMPITWHCGHQGLLILSYLFRSLADCWVTTVYFTTSFLHSSRFSAFHSMIFHSRPVHSLMLSSLRFLCLPLCLPPWTVPCRIVLASPDNRVTCPYHDHLDWPRLSYRVPVLKLMVWYYHRKQGAVPGSHALEVDTSALDHPGNYIQDKAG